MEPQDGDPAWQGRRLTTVLLSTPGHWIAYTRDVVGRWWELDTAGNGVARQSNPFLIQDQNHLVMQVTFIA